MIVITQSSPALAAPLPGLLSPWSIWCSCRGAEEIPGGLLRVFVISVLMLHRNVLLIFIQGTPSSLLCPENVCSNKTWDLEGEEPLSTPAQHLDWLWLLLFHF